MTTNQIAYWQMKEQQRSNLAKEEETARHNKAGEHQDWASYLETYRSNVAKEKENTRHNKATETQAREDYLQRESQHAIDTEQKEKERGAKRIIAAQDRAQKEKAAELQFGGGILSSLGRLLGDYIKSGS